MYVVSTACMQFAEEFGGGGRGERRYSYSYRRVPGAPMFFCALGADRRLYDAVQLACILCDSARTFYMYNQRLVRSVQCRSTTTSLHVGSSTVYLAWRASARADVTCMDRTTKKKWRRGRFSSAKSSSALFTWLLS